MDSMPSLVREAERPASSHLENRRDYDHLARYASKALGWLDSNLDQFSPFREGRVDSYYLKAFAEFTTAYTYLHQWEHPQVNHPSRWRSFITQHCENSVYAQGPRKQPVVAFGYLIPYLMLRSLEYRSAYYEETLDFLRMRRYLRCVELAPYRILEREHLLWKSGYVTNEASWSQFYRATTLGQNLHPLCIDDEAAYSVTHTLFYLTDFGNRRGPFSSPEIQRIKEVVECLLLNYWRTGFWDLLGELLIGLNCLGLRESPVYEGAALAFENAWQANGSIPAKGELLSGKGRAKQEDESETEREFRDCYHATLVGVLYCLTAMNQISRAPENRLG